MEAYQKIFKDYGLKWEMTRKDNEGNRFFRPDWNSLMYRDPDVETGQENLKKYVVNELLYQIAWAGGLIWIEDPELFQKRFQVKNKCPMLPKFFTDRIYFMYSVSKGNLVSSYRKIYLRDFQEQTGEKFEKEISKIYPQYRLKKAFETNKDLVDQETEEQIKKAQMAFIEMAAQADFTELGEKLLEIALQDFQKASASFLGIAQAK